MSPLPLLSPDPPLRHFAPSFPPAFWTLGDRLVLSNFWTLGDRLVRHFVAIHPTSPSPSTTHTLRLPPLPPHLPPLRGTPYHFFGFLCSFSTVLVAMLFSRAAGYALSHTHIAPRKIVLTTPFFSLVLDVAIFSPSLLLYALVYHSAPLPGVISHRNLHLAHHFFFGYFRCLYIYGRPPPIVSSSLHAARRHLSSNHTDFGKSPSLAFYSLPWIGALLSFYFVSRHFSFQSFCMFQCVCRRKTHSAAFAPSVLGAPRFPLCAILRLLRFDLPACNTGA